jgi:hypothetical protein
MFDPYEKWLGISKDLRPVNHYQLLDITREVRDPSAIAEAAEERAGQVKAHEKGPHAEICARLLKEIRQAKLTLIHPAKRAEYDATLPDSEEDDEEETVAAAVVDDEDDLPRENRKRKKGGAKRAIEEEVEEPKQKSKTGMLLLLAGAACFIVLLAVGGVVAFIMTRPSKTVEGPPKTEEYAQNPPPKETKPEPPPPPKATEKEKPLPPPPPDVKPPQPPVEKPPDSKPAPKPGKLPVPDEAAQAKAEKELKEKYKNDYAKKKPDDKTGLWALTQSAKFLQPGREDRTDIPGWYVLLREARDLALEAQSPRLAIEAINEIDKWFQIEAHEMKFKALTALSQSHNDVVVKKTGLTALSQVKAAVDEDNYDAALRLVNFAEETVRKATPDANKPKPDEDKTKPEDKSKPEDEKKPDDETKPKDKILALIAERKTEVQGFQKDYQAVGAAQTKLKAAPDDAEANLVVGKHLCLFHRRWDEGLPLLAKCSDDVLKGVAKQDLAKPADVKGQMALGDEWWNVGMFKPDWYKMHAHERALYWYEPAETKATGESKKHLTDRIKSIQDRATARISRLQPGSYYGRNVEDLVLLLREGGGNMQSEEAVERGLDWLVQHQAKNGGWATDAFHVHGKCECGDVGEKHDIAATAFGLLPFLGAGETYPESKYNATVVKGLDYLLRKQSPEKGNFSDNAYENGLATIAVCEAYGLSRNPRLKRSAQAAVNYIVAAQFTDGSWGYAANTKGDLSVTGWQFSALKTAYYAHLKVPDATFTQVGRFLDAVTDPNGLGYGYNSPSYGLATSATGFLCREYLGWTSRRPELAKGVDQMALPQNFVTKEAPNIYFLFYATNVMHHFGGKNWETWNPKARDLLIELQDQGLDPNHSHQKGSWSPLGDAYAKQGGRLMFTSLSLLTLEVYYYSVPLNGYGPAVLLE